MAVKIYVLNGRLLADCRVSPVAQPLGASTANWNTDNFREKCYLYSMCRMYINNESLNKMPITHKAPNMA